MDLYLDINGVLLDRQGQPARHLQEFVTWATREHTCFWLTTHCRGNENRAVDVLGPLVDAQTREHLRKILPTNWDTLKTEGIYWNRDFFWIDDVLLESERNELIRRGKLDQCVLVDLNKNPDALRDVMQRLSTA